jgi:hypothetical protein
MCFWTICHVVFSALGWCLFLHTDPAKKEIIAPGIHGPGESDALNTCHL